MTNGTFDALMERYRERRPFRPFEVELTTGERFTVEDPFAFGGRYGRGAYLASGGRMYLFDRTTLARIDGVSPESAE